MQDVSERPFIGFVILVELGVRSLHLNLHVLEKAIFPLRCIQLLSLFRHQSSQGLQVPILLYLLLGLFLFRYNFTLRCQGVWLVPPLVLLVDFGSWLLIV